MLKIYFFLLTLPSSALASPIEQIRAAFCPARSKAISSLMSAGFKQEMPNLVQDFVQREKVYGKCNSVKEGAEGALKFTYAQARFIDHAEFNEKGKLLSLEMGLPQVENDTLEKLISAALKAFPEISLYTSRDGKELLSHQADKPLAVSSSARVFLLSALNRLEIPAERIVQLSPLARSVGFGLLQNWPENSYLTIDTLKSMMLGENDGAAADLLLEIVGRGEVEKEGKNLSPFLSQREFSLLMREKNPPPREEIAALLPRLASPPSRVEYPDQRTDLLTRVGWFATTRELCESLVKIKNERIIFSNVRAEMEKKRLAEKWESLALLDAEENGVKQLTLLFQAAPGASRFCASITLNGTKTVNEHIFTALTHRLSKIFWLESVGK